MTKRWGESGNIFFTLFGAVALVGVVGAATSTLMRGPVGTVVALNQRAKADSQMQIAMKLAMLEAQNTLNDCDADSFIEPVPAGTALAGLTGGGRLPAVGSTTNDPWGVPYGYCGWDHGTVTGDVCLGGTLLDGSATGQGTVIAVISAGPDRTFGVTCVDGPTGTNPYITRGANGADDLIVDMTYSEANEASGGLWSIKSGNPDQITTNRELDVSQGAQFSGADVGFDTNAQFAAGAQLDLSAGALFMLPDETMLTACSVAADKGLLRRDTGGGTQEVLQICDGAAWLDIGGAGAVVSAVGDDGEIQFNVGGVGGTGGVMGSDSGLKFNSGGGLSADGDSIFGADLDIGSDLAVGANLNVTGNSILTGTLDVDGATDFDSTIDVAGNAIFGAVLRGSDATAGAPTYSFTSDTDTGIYYASGGGLGFSYGGTTEMTLNAAGLDVTDANVQNDLTVGGILTTEDLTVNNVINADRFISDMSTTSAANPGFETEGGTGMYSAGADTLSLVTGGSSRIVIDSTGDVGIGVADPNAKLDVNGEIKVGTSSVACVAALHGAIRYVSGDLLQVCSSMTNVWEDIGTSGGGGGGAGSHWTMLVDQRLYYNDDFVGVGTADPLDDFHVGGDLLVTGSYTATPSVAVSGAGARMFFDPEGSAFRAGGVTGAQWDSGSIGGYSSGIGLDVTASGLASGAFGREVSATGPYAFAYGLGDSTGTLPIVSGTSSYGIFMGDQNGINLAANNTLALLGGKMIIDQTPAANPAVSGTLSLDVEGGVGAAQYCDENGANCFTALSVATGGVAAPGTNREVVFNSGGVLGTDANFVFNSAGDLTLGGTGAIKVPVGDGTNRPAAPTNGMVRYNTTNGKFEGYQAGAWQDILTSGGGAITAAGANTQIQFNSGGVLGADADYTWDMTNNILGIANSGTAAVRVGNGAVGTPSFSFTTDTNTGLYNVGADAVGIAANGVNYLTIQAPGVANASAIFGGSAAVTLPSGATGTRPSTGVNGMIRYNTDNGKFEAYQGGLWQDILTAGGGAITAAGANTEIQFNSGGVLGADADYTWDMTNNILGIANSGTAAVRVGNGAVGTPSFSFTTDPNTGLYNIAADTIGFATNGVEVARLTTGQMGMVAGAVGTPAYSFTGDLNTGLYNAGTDAIGVAANGVNYLTIQAPGAANASAVFGGSAAVTLPSGATAQRPSTGVNGMIRYNSESGKFEAYQGGLWQDILTAGGGAIAINDLSDAISNTSSTLYLGTGSGTVSTGSGNTAAGINTLASNVAKQESTAVGLDAMRYADSTAVGAVTYNTALGAYALRGSTTAANNTGTANTALGHSALLGVTSGSNNIAIGRNAGGAITTGDYNVIIGVNLNPPTAGTNNYLNIADAFYGDMTAGNFVLAGAGALTLPRGDTASRPGSAVNGMLRYNSVSGKFEGYQAGAWQDILTSGLAGGAAAPDRGIQFNSGGNFAASSNLIYAADGDLLLSGTYTGTASVPATGAGTRMFFDTQSGAFRVGTVTGTGWDNTYMGLHSVATGYGTVAAGDHSLAFGREVFISATGDGSAAFGLSATGPSPNPIVSGAQSFALFMGAQSGVDFNVSNTMGVFGGKIVVDPRVPAQQMTARATLDLGASTDAVLLPIGQVGNRPASPVNGMLRYNSVSGKFEGYQAGSWQDIVTGSAGASGSNTEIQFNSGGIFGADADYTWDLANNVMTIANSGTGAVRVGNGAVGAPSFSFSTDTNTGLYNIAADTIGFVTNGAEVARLTTGQMGMVAGAVGTPAYSFTGDLNTGLYNVGADALGVAANGVNYLTIQAPGATNSSAVFGGSAAVTLPAGATGSRPSTGVNGMIRYNSQTDKFEGYQAGVWTDMIAGAGSIAIDNLSDAESDYVTDFNLFMGTPADAWAIAATGQYNLALGQLAGDSITTADNNIAIGYRALTTVTTGGSYNLAIGKDALTATTTGANNVAIGDSSLVANTVGYGNIVIGKNVMASNVGGSETTAIGYNAMLYANSVAGVTTTYNTAIGALALQGSVTASANTGTNNTAVGHSALKVNAGGWRNTAVGDASLSANTTGTFNTAVGQGALSTNISGNDNTAIGVTALQYNLGEENTAIGVNAIQGIIGVPLTGVENVGIGKTALQNLQGYTSYNVAIGSSAGSNITTGAYNIMIGHNADAPSATASNQLNIGGLITGTTNAGLMQIVGTGALTVPRGDTAQRPTGVNGMIRYNSQTAKFEGYQGGVWTDIITAGASASAPDRGIQFNSGGSFAATSNLTWTTGGTFKAIGQTASTSMTGTWEDVATGGIYSTQTSVPGSNSTAVKAAIFGEMLHGSTSSITGAGHNMGVLGRVDNMNATGNVALGIGVEGRCDSTTGDFTICAAVTATFGTDTANAGAIAIPIGYYVPAQADDAHLITPFAYLNNWSRARTRTLGSMDANEYCDETGANCFEASDVINSDFAYGADGVIQYASAGRLWGSTNYIWNNGTSTLTVTGNQTITGTLDLTGTGAINVPRGDTAQRPGSPVNGMLRYNSQTGKFEGYQAGVWTDIITAGGTAASPDRGIQFNSGGSFAANAGLVFSSTGDLMVSGSFTGVGSPPATGAGTRMFFDVQKAAFRAGRVDGTQWDEASIGDLSMAMGDNAIASSNSAVALGNTTTASGWNSVALGSWTTASGGNSTAIGTLTTAAGNYSLAAGREVNVTSGGIGSFGLGLTATAPATDPQVSGTQSFGIFMGNHSAVNFSAANTMGLFGGKMVIDPNVPATQLTARSVLDLGAATDSVVLPRGTTAQQPGSPVNGMIRYNTTTNKFEGYQNGTWTDIITSGGTPAGANTQVQFNSGGAFGASANFAWNNSTNALAVTGKVSVTDRVSIAGTAGAAAPVGLNIDDLGDVVITAAANGECLTYNGTNWVDGACGAGGGAIDDLSDGKTDYATDFNLWMGQNAGNGIASGGQYNTVIGIGSGDVISTGDYNTGLGFNALTATNTGSANTAIGVTSLADNTTGVNNTALGVNSLRSNVAKQENTAVGAEAMRYADSTASASVAYNTAVGYGALRGSATASANTGVSNTAIGHSSMLVNTTGTDNVAVGSGSLFRNTTGSSNAALGEGALYEQTIGTRNTAVGWSALTSNVAKQESTAVGYAAMQYADSSGTGAITYNTAVGAFALQGSATASANTGTANTALGYGALMVVTSGASNIAIGDRAGDNLTTGSSNIMIGSNIDFASATGSNQLNIGGLITGTTNAGLMQVVGTGALTLPIGTTAQQPGAPANGMIRYNTTTNKFEGRQNGSWVDMIGGAGSVALSSLTAASGANAINNAANTQTWNWDSLTTGTGMVMGSSSITSGSVLFVSTTNASMSGNAIFGTTNSTTANGTAIKGTATGTTGATYGVYGSNASTSGTAVYGTATATTGVTNGVYGANSSTGGRGVYGYASAATGTTYGVHGYAASTGGTGTYGIAAAATGTTYGIYGQSESTGGIGVEGYAPAATGTTFGTRGYANSTGGTGIYGETFAATGTTYGVYGTSASTGGYGGYFTGSNWGVYSAMDAGIGAGKYLNWGTTRGSGGYGIRDNAGVIECKNSGGGWAACAGGGATPAGADREIQFNSGGAFSASSTYKLMADGDLLLSGTYTGTASVPATGAGTRMFFDTQKAALRAGYIGSTQWDNGNIGDYSVALGYSTTASSSGSVAMGFQTTASGSYSVAMGANSTASGQSSVAMGSSTASGLSSFSMGDSTQATGIASTAMGKSVIAGNGTAGSGQGDGSMALGLIDNAVTITTRSQVTGIQSMGIFMGDQDGLVMTGANTMALFGGKMVIDTAVPATFMGAPTYNLSFSGDTADQTIGMERETTNTTAGRNLTINAGGADAGSTDLAGGNLVLQSGITTGNGLSNILFQTVVPGQGTGTTDRSPATSMTLASNSLTIPTGATTQEPGQAGMQAAANGMMRYDTTTNKFRAYQNGAWTDMIGGAGSVAIDDLTDAAKNLTTNNIFMGHEGGGSVGANNLYNTGIGISALDSLNSASSGGGLGDGNTAIGMNALTAVTSGWANTAVGAGAGDSITSGGSNIAIGSEALSTVSNTNENTAVGNSALTVTTGSGNTALGDVAGRYLRTGTGNIMIGAGAAEGETVSFTYDGSDNVIIGTDAAYNLDGTNNRNTIIGADTAANLTAGGSDNILIGYGINVPTTTSTYHLNIGGLITGTTNAGLMQIVGTGALTVPVGTTAQQPGSPVNGMIRYNSQTSKFEGYQAGAWVDMIGGAGSVAIDNLTDAKTDYATDFNLWMGQNAGNGILAGGQYNFAIGQNAGDSITTGDYNLGLGYNALTAVTTATDNVGVGYNALAANTANQITAVGSTALDSNTSGQHNTAVGYAALTVNTTGANSTALGKQALAASNGSWNTALGAFSLLVNTSGASNTAVGYLTLSAATTVASNTAVGYAAMMSVTGGSNTALGSSALTNGAGSYNVALGGSAMSTGSSGSGNVAVGQAALQNVTGNENVAIGYSTGSTLTSGGSNILIGNNIEAASATGSNQLNIGDLITGTTNAGLMQVVGTGALTVPIGTTAQQPGSPVNGMIRYNSQTAKFEGYQAGAWTDMIGGGGGGGAIDDLSDAISNTTSTVFLGTGSGTSSTGTGNTAVGINTLASNVARQENTAIGLDAMRYADSTATTQVSANTAIGAYALQGSTTASANIGGENTAVGHRSMMDNTTGNWNTAIGQQSLENNTTGSGNTALGEMSMWGNATALTGSNNSAGGMNSLYYIQGGADRNTAFGGNALYNNRAKDDSTAIGYMAMSNADSSTTSAITYNTAVGAYALQGGGTPASNTGVSNTAVGHSSMMANTTGIDNASVGSGSLASNTTGSYNAALGEGALYDQTIGTRNTALGWSTLTTNVAKQESTAVGYAAMRYGHSTGTGSITYNTALGAFALQGSGTAGNNTGTANTALGHSALMNVTSGASNIAIGDRAGDNLTTGSTNIIIGSNIDFASATGSSQLNIGGTIYGDMSQDRIGIGAVPAAGVELDVTGDIQYTGTITDVSDMRLKTDINELNDRGSMLAKLDQIGTYSFRMKDDKEGTLEFGVMAQEINKVFPELVRTDKSTPENYMSVNYVGLIAPMIEATKELKAENEALKAELASVKSDRETMVTALNDLSRDVQGLKAHTGYGINKAQIGLGLIVGMMLMGGMSAVILLVANRRRKPD